MQYFFLTLERYQIRLVLIDDDWHPIYRGGYVIFVYKKRNMNNCIILFRAWRFFLLIIQVAPSIFQSLRIDVSRFFNLYMKKKIKRFYIELAVPAGLCPAAHVVGAKGYS